MTSTSAPMVPNSPPISQLDGGDPAADLTSLLEQHSDRDLLLILTSQLLETQVEVRILQATVNTLLIELCHRQPDKLSQNLNRMSVQRRQELLTEFHKHSEAFGRPLRVDPLPA